MSEPTSPPTPQTPEFLPPSGPVTSPQQGYPPAGEPAAATPGTPVPGASDASAGAPAESVPENVGRGLLFSLPAIVVGAVAAIALYQAGYIASITSLLMAGGAVWLYAKGAGAPPRKGIVPLIVVIVVGVVLTLFALLASTLYFEITAEYPGAPAGDVWTVVFDNLFYPPVWGAFAGDAGMFALFAALGAFGTLFQLGRAARQA